MANNKLSLAQKLADIRAEVSITKNGRNDFGKYDYYQLDDIYSSIKKILASKGIFTTFEQEPCGEVVNETTTHEPQVMTVQLKRTTEEVEKKQEVAILVTNSSITTQMVKSTLTVYDTESDDKFVFSNISEMNRGKGMQPAQNAGANVTYQSKYNYAALLMLDDGALDPDSEEMSKKQSSKTTKSASNSATDNFEL